jgi:hypothetical protein
MHAATRALALHSTWGVAGASWSAGAISKLANAAAEPTAGRAARDAAVDAALEAALETPAEVAAEAASEAEAAPGAPASPGRGRPGPTEPRALPPAPASPPGEPGDEMLTCRARGSVASASARAPDPDPLAPPLASPATLPGRPLVLRALGAAAGAAAASASLASVAAPGVSSRARRGSSRPGGGGAGRPRPAVAAAAALAATAAASARASKKSCKSRRACGREAGRAAPLSPPGNGMCLCALLCRAPPSTAQPGAAPLHDRRPAARPPLCRHHKSGPRPGPGRRRTRASAASAALSSLFFSHSTSRWCCGSARCRLKGVTCEHHPASSARAPSAQAGRRPRNPKPCRPSPEARMPLVQQKAVVSAHD